MPSRRPMRYAHAEGHTDVCYSDSGENIITCGSDGDVRIWTDLTDDDPSSQCVGEHAIAIAVQSDRFYVGTDNNHVQSYTFPGAERDGIVSRFTAPVTHISTIKSGSLIASGSCDMEIHVKNKETAENIVLLGHKAPILGVALDPKGIYLASSSCDGSVRMWNLEDKSTVKSWDCVPTSNSFFTATCLARVSWEPERGLFLAIPDGTAISGYERDTWDKVFSFTDDQATHPFSIASFSTCGLYLAASTSNGDICIWNVKSKDLVSRSSHDRRYSICGLAWNPSGNGEIAYCDITGQLGTVEDCIPSSSADQSEIKRRVAESGFDLDNPIKSHSYVDDDDDDDNENVFSIEKIRAEVSKSSNLDFDNDLSNTGINDDVESRPASRLAPPIIDLQSPFQPGSTPSHLQHRYLVWNSVGIVRCQNTEIENSIDVEFTDTAIHHALHINNFLKHSLATLTDQALVLAAEALEDVPSKVVCVLLNSWDGQKEWTMNLPDEEEALAIAAGQGWMAVATDTRNLRLFTIAGSQREVIALPGPVVSLAAHGKRLIVVYHNGLGLPGDQNLGFAVFNVCPNELVMSTSWQLMPMSPKTTLQWIGFSDEGSPITVDSAGMMRLLSGKGYWMPICNTTAQCKGKSDHYFIIGISERYENIRCILCKGARYPPTTPKPLVTEISFKLPLCEDTTEKSQLEEKFWISQLIAPSITEQSRFDSNYISDKEANESTMKQTIIKLFAHSCRSGFQEQALELGGLMPSEQVVQLAIKYASKLNKNHLADKLREAMITRDVYDDLDRYAQNTVVKSPPLRTYSSSRPETDDEYDHHVSESRSTPELNGHTSEPDNMLLAAKKQKTSDQIKPMLVSSGSRKNPFKKSVSNQMLDSSGLNLLSSSCSQLTNNKPTKQNTTPDLAVKGPKSKQMKLQISVNSKPTSNKKPVVTFMQWYATKKTMLQEEFPDLGASDLTKVALKRFREKEIDTLDTSLPEPVDSPVVEIKKRKLAETNDDSQENEENEEQGHNDVVNKISKQDDQGNEEVNKATKCDSQEQDKNVKPLTAKSKLMAFLYKKTS